MYLPQEGQYRSAAGIAISPRVYSANDPETIKRSQFAGLNWEHRYFCPGAVRLHNENSVCSVAGKDTVSGCCEDHLYTADTRAIQREPTVGPVNDQDAGIRGRMHSAWCFSWGNPHHSRFYFFSDKGSGIL